MDVAAWLQNFGLERHGSAFRADDIDAGVRLTLTVEDLISIGVTSPAFEPSRISSLRQGR